MEAGNRILIVDDDEAVLRLVGLRLGSLGYQVATARGGAEALSLCGARAFDLVLLDISMPQMDGYAVLAKLRESHTPSALPVIMLSLLDKGPDVIQALRLGANDYVSKPIDFAVLEKRVAAQLALRAGEGNTIGGYRIRHKLGAGGMGVVYEAQDVRSGDSVALKILPRALTVNETYVNRFLRESKLAATVEHPGLVRIFGSGRDGETYFIAMELVRGHNLAQLRRQRPVELSAALGITREVAAALAALHRANIIHRDIKPENIIVADNGSVKLTDFGIAHNLALDQRMTQTGQGVGSIIYSAPEQMRGKADLRSDMYALGATLYFMLSGKDPFGENLPLDEVLDAKRKGPPTFPRDLQVPTKVKRLVASMMRPQAYRRPRSFEQLDSVLADLLGTPLPQRRPWARWLLGLGFVGALALLGYLRYIHTSG